MKPIGMTKLTSLINKAIKMYDCEKCPWENECAKINCGCSVAMTILALEKGGYLVIEKRKTKKQKRTCESCKHYRWFGEYAMMVCEKHGEVEPLGVCKDYEQKGGEK